ncbi:MAG TPA: hypothetical protein VFG12_13105 [Rhodopila sp.]|nr:hypothetical protein [Rhodopila sp.]
MDLPIDTARSHRWTARDLATRLFYRGSLFLFCLALGTLAGIVAAANSKTSYTADSSLLILLGQEFAAAPASLSLANQQISIDGLRAVQSEAQIIQADGTIRTAIQVAGQAKLYPSLAGRRWFGLQPPLRGDEQISEAIQRFRANLHVDVQPGSNVIGISFRNPDRGLAVQALQAVIDAYFAQRTAIYSNNDQSALAQEILRYQAHLTQLEADIQAVRSKYDVLDPAQDAVLATNRLDGIVQRENQVKERQVAVETEIVAVRANIATQPAEVLDFHETTNNTGNDEARNTLVRLNQERTHLAEQFNDNWPGIQELDRKIAVAKAQVSRNSGSLYFADRKIRNPALEVLNNRLASLEIEDKALSQQLVELLEQARVANERIASLRDADGQLHMLQLNRDVAEGAYRQLSLRESGTNLHADAVIDQNGSVRIAQAPTAPNQGRSLALTFVIGGVFLGLTLGVAAVVVATLLQQSYILSTDAERDLGLQCLGEIAPARTELADPQPGYSLVVSNLLRLSLEGKPLSMVSVASTYRSDGNEELAQGLGTELARRFAMRTLILDLRPPPDTLLAAPPDPQSGLAGAVAVAATAEDDLWVSVNAYHALFGARGRMSATAFQAITALRDQFAMTLVITPPGLSHPIVHRLASLVDATILVLHAEKTRPAVADRFRDVTLEAGGNLAGFIFVGRRFYVPRWLYRRL